MAIILLVKSCQADKEISIQAGVFTVIAGALCSIILFYFSQQKMYDYFKRAVPPAHTHKKKQTKKLVLLIMKWITQYKVRFHSQYHSIQLNLLELLLVLPY